MDVSNALLHGKLTDTIYMKQPPGFGHPIMPHHVCLLRKAIYGLKQSPCLWFASLTAALRNFVFLQSSADPSLFYINRPNGSHTSLSTWTIFSLPLPPRLFFNKLRPLPKAFIIKDLGRPASFLGLQIAHRNDSILLHQTSYIEQLLHTAGLQDCHIAATPQISGRPKSVDDAEFGNSTLYRHLTGSLQYLTIICPDIAYAVNVFCQHMHSPTNYNYNQIVWILRYLKGTSSFGLPISPGASTLPIYSDSH